MGVGDPLEASFKLAAPLRAGSWHLIGDGIVIANVDVQYDLLWRSAAGDVKLAGFAHHFDAPTGAGQFNAVAFDADAPGLAAAAQSGDLLVLRFTASNAPAGTPAFIPNGDGVKAKGRIPSLILPR